MSHEHFVSLENLLRDTVNTSKGALPSIQPMIKVQTIQVSSSSAAGAIGSESMRLTWSSTASWEELWVATQLSKPQALSGFLLNGQE